MSNPMRRIFERIDEAGWPRHDTGNGDYRVCPPKLPNGTLPPVMFISKRAPGDWRGLKNLESDLRKAGIPPEIEKPVKKTTLTLNGSGNGANGAAAHVDETITLEWLLSRANTLLTSITDSAAELAGVLDQIRQAAKADTDDLAAKLAKFDALRGLLKDL